MLLFYDKFYMVTNKNVIEDHISYSEWLEFRSREHPI
jgi:hypothetical protein